MIRVFKHYVSHAVIVLGLVDFALLLLAGELAWDLRIYQIGAGSQPLSERVPEIVAFAVIVMTALIGVGSYGAEALRSMRFATARLLVAVSLGVIGMSLLDFLVQTETFWRSVLLYAMALAILFLMLNRLILGPLLGTSTFRRNVLVLGAGSRADRIRQLGHRKQGSFRVVSFIAMSDAERVIPEARLRQTIPDLGRFVDDVGASEVVLALEERRNSLPVKDLLRIKTRGLHVIDFSGFIERETGRVDLDTLNPSWLIFSDGFSSTQLASAISKRIFDIAASLLLLALTFPLLALFAILIKIESRGPVFYRQTRVGHYGQHFDVVKLRSMRQDAEKDGPKWASENDPRVTRIGRIIRTVRIDEIPQAWSVLKGEMSFVGPRPERPQFVSQLEELLPYYAERHMVKPGITGWAQINYPYGASTEDARQKLEFDLYYAKNYSPFLDLLILLQTARVIIWPDGAR